MSLSDIADVPGTVIDVHSWKSWRSDYAAVIFFFSSAEKSEQRTKQHLRTIIIKREMKSSNFINGLRIIHSLNEAASLEIISRLSSPNISIGLSMNWKASRQRNSTAQRNHSDFPIDINSCWNLILPLMSIHSIARGMNCHSRETFKYLQIRDLVASETEL